MKIELPQITPGDWRIQSEFDHEPVYIVSDQDSVADLPPSSPNARAIAAVPALLSALASMLESYAPRALQSEKEDPGNLHSSVVKTLAALRSAGCTITD